MSWSKGREFLKLLSIVLWLIFTTTFALWWLKFSLEHLSLLAALQPEKFEHWARERRMILWEGGSWIVLLALGGLALTGLVQRERWRVQRIRQFFASFSHEIKTSLASLRIQVEALQDEQIQSPILDRLVSDTVRLALQLENSLFLASADALKLFIEPLVLGEMVQILREQWPNLKIEFGQDCTLRGDERALRTTFSNLMQNAVIHGKARAVKIVCEALPGDRVRVSLTDNGSGFRGETKRLGQLFHRPTASSGSGLGLYISRLLLRKMNGDLVFLPSPSGFSVGLILEGRLK